MDILKAFGLRVKDLRVTRGLSQEKFAELADLHRTYISQLERGIKNPTLTSMEKIANATSITLSELLKFKEEEY